MPDHSLNRTPVDIPGGVRTDFPDGGHLIEGPIGEKYPVSESGAIGGTVPMIRRVEIEDLSRVLRHEIAQVFETTSHTLHFAGGGVFSLSASAQRQRNVVREPQYPVPDAAGWRYRRMRDLSRRAWQRAIILLDTTHSQGCRPRA